MSQFFLRFFANFYVSWYSSIDYGTISLILICYNNIWFPCLDLSVTLNHNISQMSFYSYSATPSGACSYDFWLLFRLFFPRTILATINNYSLLLLLCQHITFSHSMGYCFTFVVTHSVKWWLGCFICSSTTFNMAFVSTFKSVFLASSIFLFLFLAFILQTVHTFFCFSIVSSFVSSNSVWIPSDPLYDYIILFLTFSQWLNWIPDIPSQVVFFHSYTFLTKCTSHPLPEIPGTLLKVNAVSSNADTFKQLLTMIIPMVFRWFLSFSLTFLKHSSWWLVAFFIVFVHSFVLLNSSHQPLFLDVTLPF